MFQRTQIKKNYFTQYGNELDPQKCRGHPTDPQLKLIKLRIRDLMLSYALPDGSITTKAKLIELLKVGSFKIMSIDNDEVMVRIY